MNKRNAAGFAALCITAALLSGCQAQAAGTVRSGGDTYSGLQTIDGEVYYFSKDGTKATGWLEVDGKRCYFRGDGVRVTGWLSIEGQKYYLGADGTATTGPADIDGTAYLFDADGKLTSGWAEVDGNRYYGNENGHPMQGWQEIDGEKYCFSNSFAALTGWQEMDGFTYYFQEDGSAASGEMTIDGEIHRFASNGQEVILVNPWHYVPEGYTVELQNIGGGHQIATIAVADFEEMMTACENAGLDPVVCSSYRTYEYQDNLFSRRVRRYVDDGYSEEEATKRAATSVAIPGTSEHQLGLAVDIVDNHNWSLDESQAKMPTQQWLMENSWKFGWILRYPNEKSEITGIIYEPWHYRYVGRAVAAEIHELGVCLEEYLELLTKA